MTAVAYLVGVTRVPRAPAPHHGEVAREPRPKLERRWDRMPPRRRAKHRTLRDHRGREVSPFIGRV